MVEEGLRLFHLVSGTNMSDNKVDFDEAPGPIQLKSKPTGVSTLSGKFKVMAVVVFTLAILMVLVATVATWNNNPVSSQNPEDDAGTKSDKAVKKIATMNMSEDMEDVSDGSAAVGAQSAEVAGVDALGTVPAAGNEAGSKVPQQGQAKADKAGPLVGEPPLGGADHASVGSSQAKSEQDRRFEQDLMQAKRGHAAVDGWGSGGAGGAEREPGSKVGEALGSLTQAVKDAGAGAAEQMRAAQGADSGQDDVNKQKRKEAFLRMANSQVDNINLPEVRRPALSKYTVAVGSVIPAALGCGINTDLPGQICARVTQNIYDSATHTCLLIPQGATVIGAPDSQVAMGQQRILTAWNTLVFDDASTLSLRGMPGADMSGKAGFDAKVDNHYTKVIGIAAIASVFSAGLQLSQPNNGGGSTTAPSVGQTMAGTIGQQVGQTGMQVTQKQLQVQPTLTDEPGYPFVIQVTKSIVFDRPYRGSC